MPPQKTPPHRIMLLLICLIWLGFGLRLYNLGANSLWYDELLQVDIAQDPLDQILPHMERHAAMPLDYVVLHLWLKLGRQEFWLRWPALLFSTLAMAWLYRLGRVMFNRQVGLLAASLLAMATLAIQYSREVRPYGLLLLLTLVTVYGVWRAYQTRRLRYWGLAGGGLVAAAFTHYFALLLLLPLGLFVAGQQLRHWRARLFWSHTLAFTIIVGLTVALLGLSGRFKSVYNVSFGAAQVVTAPAELTLPAAEKPNRGSGPPLTRAFWQERVLGPLATHAPAGLLLFSSFFLAAVLSLLPRTRTPRGGLLLLCGWLFLPILLIYLFLLQRGTFYATRYILYTLPAYVLLVAFGVTQVGDLLARWLMRLPSLTGRGAGGKRLLSEGRWPPFSSGLLAGLLLLPLLWIKAGEVQTLLTAETREDWRAVGQLLQTHAAPGDVVIAVRAEPTMNWYYPPATAPFGQYDRLPRVWQAINRQPRRWFVLSSYSARRDAALRDWLANNGAVAIGIDRRVVLYVQQDGRSPADLLAEVAQFALPAKPLTYLSLARQFERYGDSDRSRVFYEKALDLADSQLSQRLAHEIAASQNQIKPDDDGFCRANC